MTTIQYAVPTPNAAPEEPVTHTSILLRQLRERLIELESIVDKLETQYKQGDYP